MIETLQDEEILEQMHEQMLLRSLFVARQADDARYQFRRLLRAIGCLGEARSGGQPGSGLDKVREACTDLDRALFGMTDFGKGATRLLLAGEKFELHTLLRAAVASQVYAAKARGIELSCLVHRDVPRKACGDPAGLRQVLGAFVENAIRYTADEKVLVRISAENFQQETFSLCCAVEDAGNGISRRMQSGGNGPGFEIFRDLVDLMGGEIGVETADEVWFTVSLKTPADLATPTIADMPVRATGTVPIPHHPILLVSNDPDGVSEILVCLQRRGYTVELEQDRMRFPVRLRERDFSMVLMDADGGSHVATLATWPCGGRLRRVPVVGVPRTGAQGKRVDEEALVRIVETCIRNEHGDD